MNYLLFMGPNSEKFKKNFVGICTDHASNMISYGNAGLSNRLKADFPYIFTTHDYCHAYRKNQSTNTLRKKSEL